MNKRHKVRWGLCIAVMLVLSLLVLSLPACQRQPQPQTESPTHAENILIIHYQRNDGDYDPWSIWAWGEGMEGAAYPFTGEDAFGVYAEIEMSQNSGLIGFIVRTDSWEKDVGDDRFIDLALGQEIWVYTETPEFLYEPPEGYGGEAVPIPSLSLTIHYNRYDGHYEGLKASVSKAADGKEQQASVTQEDDFGAVHTFELKDLTTQDKLTIRLNHSSGEETFTIPLLNVNTDVSEVYLVSGSNEQSFNLIENVSRLKISAMMDTPNEINAVLSYPVSVTAVGQPGNGFTVKDLTDGTTVSIAQASPLNEGRKDDYYKKLTPGYATAFNLTFSDDLQLDHNYVITGFGSEETAVSLGKVYTSKNFEEVFHYNGQDLGVTYTPAATSFRLWAPIASSVELILGENTWPMKRDVNGTWVYTADGDFNGVIYNYAVTNYGKRSELVDPYAKAVGVNGKTGVVMDLTKTNPAGWENDKRPALNSPTDAVIYELHVRDFSIHSSSGMTNQGKFLAFTEKGTTTPDGQKTGVDHLLEMGVTHVHLLPVFDYASLDESKVDSDGFNWGYDPLNYNAVEGTYATDPFLPNVRINEFKQLIQSLHDNGIGVIMDVVYNHTGPSSDSNLNLAVPNYYYRMTKNGGFSNGSGCGNETASERSMVGKFMVDSVAYWAKEYHIDGFRFDLMGLHDTNTMNNIRAALDNIDRNIIMYGEGWAGGSTPLPNDQAALKANMSAMDSLIAAFSDDIRDGIKGSVFNAKEPGFVNGNAGRKEDVKFGVVGSVQHPQVILNRVSYSNNFWAKSPTQTITYASAHDNLTLWDKLNESAPNASEAEHLAMNRIAAAIVLTSQGIPFIHAGEEIARSKDGDENSYQSPDSVNQIRWDTKANRRELFDYYRGLIALRKAYPAFRMTQAADVRTNINFLDTEAKVLAYTLNGSANGGTAGTILVVFNADTSARELTLPQAEWDVLVNGTKAGTETLTKITSNVLSMEPLSSYVLISSQNFETSKASMGSGDVEPTTP